jgi:bla regulator protein blaR1
MKETSVFALVQGKTKGPNLTESTLDCAQSGQPKPGERGCGQMRMQRGRLDAGTMPISQLATSLSNQLGRPVIDKTGLTAKYNITLEWTPDETQPPLGGVVDPTRPPSNDSTGPTIYAAVQEQLGLKLESEKAPVDMLVIDSAEKASEN